MTFWSHFLAPQRPDLILCKSGHGGLPDVEELLLLPDVEELLLLLLLLPLPLLLLPDVEELLLLLPLPLLLPAELLAEAAEDGGEGVGGRHVGGGAGGVAAAAAAAGPGDAPPVAAGADGLWSTKNWSLHCLQQFLGHPSTVTRGDHSLHWQGLQCLLVRYCPHTGHSMVWLVVPGPKRPEVPGTKRLQGA